jgi:hypothetical protein
VQVEHESVHGIKRADRDVGYGPLAGAKRTIAYDRDLPVRAAEQNPRALVVRDGFSWTYPTVFRLLAGPQYTFG